MSSDKVLKGILAASSVGALLGTAYVLYKAVKEDQEVEFEHQSTPSDKETGVQSGNGQSPLMPQPSEKRQAPVSLDTSFRMEEGDGRDLSSQIFKICISGGPKSGVTTAISKISENLSSLGYKVFVVPSCQNLTANAGFNIFDESLPMEDRLQVLICFMKMLMKCEDYFVDMAHDEEDRNVVVLYNRGTMDIKAQIKPDLWEAMLSEAGWSEMSLRDKRYDMVMHLVTSAEGAVEFYDDKVYTSEEAKNIDKKMNACWNGHSKYIIVKNMPGQPFREKIAYCMTSVNSLIGLPTKNKYYQKFLLDYQPEEEIAFPSDLYVEKHNLSDCFLKSTRKEVQIRLSKRSRNGVNRFVYSCRAPSKVDGEHMEMMKQINAQEYMEYKTFMIRGTHEIEKAVFTFIYDNISYQIERFLSTSEKPSILRVEGTQEVSIDNLPKFLKIKEDITENPKYFTFYLATNSATTS